MILFDHVYFPPFENFHASAPDGAVIGVIGEDGAGKMSLLRLAAGADIPVSGSVQAPRPAKILGPGDALNFDASRLLSIDRTLDAHDAVTRARAALALDRKRRAGDSILLVTHREELLRDLCDEIWWIEKARIRERGGPPEILAAWHSHVARKLRELGDGAVPVLSPSLRRGDGRAQILKLELLGQSGEPSAVWSSGEPASIRVTVQFKSAVADPVVGILIRTRIGLNVYGTNTELERLSLGPCAASDTLSVTFAFQCELCPGEYTVTTASHDPDGVWHEWLEDAAAFSVVDSRYTAGVANLRAEVSVDRLKNIE